MTERLEDENFEVNSDVDGKFDFILLDEDLSKNPGVKYDSCVTPTDKKYDDMIVGGRPDDEDEVIDKYLNMNFIFDVVTNDERRETVVKHSQGLDGRLIGRSQTNPFFDTREYEIYFTDGTWDKYAANIIAEICMRRWMTRVISFNYLRRYSTIRSMGRRSKRRKERSGLPMEWRGIISQLEDVR